MNALELNSVMNLSIEYIMNGSRLRRNVKAGKTDAYGVNWLLVDTEDEKGGVSRQWVDMKFFQKWMGQVGIAA